MPLIGSVSGSHTRLSTGAVFLVAGPNITIATGVLGAVEISSSLAATVPGGATTEVQFNSGGAFGSDNSFSFDTTTKSDLSHSQLMGSDLRGSLMSDTQLSGADLTGCIT